MPHQNFCPRFTSGTSGPEKPRRRASTGQAANVPSAFSTWATASSTLARTCQRISWSPQRIRVRCAIWRWCLGRACAWSLPVSCPWCASGVVGWWFVICKRLLTTRRPTWWFIAGRTWSWYGSWKNWAFRFPSLCTCSACRLVYYHSRHVWQCWLRIGDWKMECGDVFVVLIGSKFWGRSLHC